MKKIITLLLATNLSAAQVLLQASYGTQLSPSIIRMAGYYVQFDQQMTSPYDVGLGYMFNFKNMFVLPVMLEGLGFTNIDAVSYISFNFFLFTNPK